MIRLTIYNTVQLVRTRVQITSRVPSKDKLSDFIINKDEKRVWEGTEPPTEPVYRAQNINQRSRQEITVYLFYTNTF